MNTNRRNFIKSSVVATIASVAFPYIGLGESNLKRNKNGLFTIKELRIWCNKNKFHYIENNDLKIEKDASFLKYINYTNNGIKLKLSRLPFLYNTEFGFNRRYECLKYMAVDLHTIYKHFYLYDIEDITTFDQKEKGNCSANFLYCGVKYDNITYESKQEKLKNCSNVYCIKNECWYKPIIVDSNLDSGLKYCWVDRYEKSNN